MWERPRRMSLKRWPWFKPTLLIKRHVSLLCLLRRYVLLRLLFIVPHTIPTVHIRLLSNQMARFQIQLAHLDLQYFHVPLVTHANRDLMLHRSLQAALFQHLRTSLPHLHSTRSNSIIWSWDFRLLCSLCDIYNTTYQLGICYICNHTTIMSTPAACSCWLTIMAARTTSGIICW